MIKECNVIMRNSAVMVVKFEDIELQMFTDNTKDKLVYVELKDGKYLLSNKENYDKQNKKTVKKVKGIVDNIEELTLADK